MIRTSLAALLLCVVPLSAQITLDAQTLRLPIGITFTLESLLYTGTLTETAIDISPAGADQFFDLSGPLDAPVRIEVRATVIPLGQAPNSDQYPEADFAALYETLNPNGSSEETYAYFSSSTTTFRNGGQPPVTTTQVLRLLEASGVPSVVAAVGWGQLKAIHTSRMQARP